MCPSPDPKEDQMAWLRLLEEMRKAVDRLSPVPMDPPAWGRGPAAGGHEQAPTEDPLTSLLASWAQRSAPSPPLTPPDQELADLIGHPSVVLITGHRNSGKTGLANRLLQLLQVRAAPWVVGLPPKAARLLPEGFGLADDPWEVPKNSVVYIPEAYRLFGARSTQSQQGRLVTDLVNLSRHRRHTLIFDAQNPAHVDRNIVSEVDIVLVKQPGPFHEGFDRPQLSDVMDAASAAFAPLSGVRLKQAVWVVAPMRGISGRLMMNLLPTFWGDALSRIFADARPPGLSTGTSAVGSQRRALRPGRRHSPQELARRAKELRAAGYSYGQIATVLGFSRTHAWRLVNKR